MTKVLAINVLCKYFEAFERSKDLLESILMKVAMAKADHGISPKKATTCFFTDHPFSPADELKTNVPFRLNSRWL